METNLIFITPNKRFFIFNFGGGGYVKCCEQQFLFLIKSLQSLNVGYKFQSIVCKKLWATINISW